MFDVFKEAGLKQSYYNQGSNTYTTFEKPPEWDGMYISTDKFLIRNIYTIYLCANEMVLTSKLDDMKVNVKYINVERLVIGAEEYG